MNHYNRSPRGFVYLSQGQSFPRSGSVTFNPTLEHSVGIEARWSRYLHNLAEVTPVVLVLPMIEELKSTFGDFRQWLWVNVSANNLVNDLCLDFLKDTLQFIETGSRSMSIDTWYNLIERNPTPTELSQDRIDNFKKIYIPNTEEMLAKWCGNENGVVDLFKTAHILFGK